MSQMPTNEEYEQWIANKPETRPRLCHICGDEPATATCEACQMPFCSDCGTPGGDRLVGEVEVAYPSCCDLCRGC